MIKYVFLFTISVCWMMNVNADDSKHEVLAEYQYVIHSSESGKVKQAISSAIQQNKLLLVALGATWCHDSRALNAMFSTSQMHQILQQKYVVMMQEIGYFEHGLETLDTLGLSMYYGTPTVIIYDPIAQTVLNRRDFSTWTNAASHAPDFYFEYFADTDALQSNPSSEQLLSDEQRNAIDAAHLRLINAYNIVGPLLKLDEEDPTSDKTKFYALWQELKRFRTGLDQDIVSLLEYTDQTLPPPRLPEYPLMSWELDD